MRRLATRSARAQACLWELANDSLRHVWYSLGSRACGSFGKECYRSWRRVGLFSRAAIGATLMAGRVYRQHLNPPWRARQRTPWYRLRRRVRGMLARSRSARSSLAARPKSIATPLRAEGAVRELASDYGRAWWARTSCCGVAALCTPEIRVPCLSKRQSLTRWAGVGGVAGSPTAGACSFGEYRSVRCQPVQ